MGGGRTPSSRSGHSQISSYPLLILNTHHFILKVQLFHKILSQGGTQAQEQTQSHWSIHAGLQEVEVAVVGHLVNKGETPGVRQGGASGRCFPPARGVGKSEVQRKNCCKAAKRQLGALPKK